jgi:hypothetical protein
VKDGKLSNPWLCWGGFCATTAWQHAKRLVLAKYWQHFQSKPNIGMRDSMRVISAACTPTLLRALSMTPPTAKVLQQDIQSSTSACGQLPTNEVARTHGGFVNLREYLRGRRRTYAGTPTCAPRATWFRARLKYWPPDSSLCAKLSARWGHTVNFGSVQQNPSTCGRAMQ